jgi:hypothetical protein
MPVISLRFIIIGIITDTTHIIIIIAITIIITITTSDLALPTRGACAANRRSATRCGFVFDKNASPHRRAAFQECGTPHSLKPSFTIDQPVVGLPLGGLVMEARVEEISAGVYRLSIFVPDVLLPPDWLRSVLVHAGMSRSCAMEPLSVHTIVWSDKQIS